MNGISVERRDRVAVVWLDRARAAAVHPDMQIELHERLAESDLPRQRGSRHCRDRAGRFFHRRRPRTGRGANFADDEQLRGARERCDRLLWRDAPHHRRY